MVLLMMICWWGVTAGLRPGAHRGLCTCADTLPRGLQPGTRGGAGFVNCCVHGHRVNVRAFGRRGASDGLGAFCLRLPFARGAAQVLGRWYVGARGCQRFQSCVKSMNNKLKGKLNPLLVRVLHQWVWRKSLRSSTCAQFWQRV